MQSTLKNNKHKETVNAEIQNNMRIVAQIFDEYGDLIRDMIRFRVNDTSIVDDIFQDLFVSLVHRPIPPYIQNIKGYLCMAVKNDVLDEAFQTRSYHTRNRKYAELHTKQVKFHNPQDVAILSEEIRKLFSIIERQLMPHEREAIIQRYQIGRDNHEAAEAMHIDRRSFSHYLCTGLKNVRRFAHQGEKRPKALCQALQILFR